MKQRVWVVCGKAYSVCAQCGRIVRLNKPVLGDLHRCVPDEEASS